MKWNLNWKPSPPPNGKPPCWKGHPPPPCWSGSRGSSPLSYFALFSVQKRIEINRETDGKYSRPIPKIGAKKCMDCASPMVPCKRKHQFTYNTTNYYNSQILWTQTLQQFDVKLVFFADWLCFIYFGCLPGSDRTSFAAAMSINFFSAFFFSSGSLNWSGCHFTASLRYAFVISLLLAFLSFWNVDVLY